MTTPSEQAARRIQAEWRRLHSIGPKAVCPKCNRTVGAVVALDGVVWLWGRGGRRGGRGIRAKIIRERYEAIGLDFSGSYQLSKGEAQDLLDWLTREAEEVVTLSAQASEPPWATQWDPAAAVRGICPGCGQLSRVAAAGDHPLNGARLEAAGPSDAVL